jgi:hypothetical protein
MDGGTPPKRPYLLSLTPTGGMQRFFDGGFVGIYTISGFQL